VVPTPEGPNRDIEKESSGIRVLGASKFFLCTLDSMEEGRTQDVEMWLGGVVGD